MSVGKVCIKRFKFACMTILSPEIVSIVLCQCSIMDMQVPHLPNQPKTAEILAQNAFKTHMEATINQKFSRGRSPEPPLREGQYPLSCSPRHSRSDYRQTTFKYVATGLVYNLASYRYRRNSFVNTELNLQ